MQEDYFEEHHFIQNGIHNLRSTLCAKSQKSKNFRVLQINDIFRAYINFL